MVTRTNTAAGAGAPLVTFGILSTMFATDSALENDGAWMKLADGVRIRVRSQQSDLGRIVAREINEEHAAANALGAFNPADADAQDVELFARALVTDWEGIPGADGEPIVCTVESVRLVLTQLPHLRRAISRFSANLDNYRPKR